MSEPCGPPPVPGYRRVPASWRAALAAAARAADGAEADAESPPETGSLASPSPPGSLASPSPTLPTVPHPEAPSIAWLIPQAVRSLWDYQYKVLPMLHRPSFEAAMEGRPSVYSRRPVALMYAMACTGARRLPIPEMERNAVAKYCLDRAVELLLARNEDDLETAQALFCLCDTVLLAGVPRRMVPLLARTATCCEALFARMAPGLPETEIDWLFREQLVRLQVLVASMDLGVAQNAEGWTLLAPWFSRPSPVPASDELFYDPDTAGAFQRFRHEHWAEDHTFTFPSPLDLAAGASAIRDLVARPFSGRGSIVCMNWATTFLCYVLLTLKQAASAGRSGDDPRALALGAVSTFYDVFCSAVPADFAQALEAGDLSAFYSGEPLLGTLERTDFAAQMAIRGDAVAVATFVALDFPSAALLRASRILSLSRSIRRADPSLEHGHHSSIFSVYLAGRVVLGARHGTVLAGPPAEHGARTLWEAELAKLDAMAEEARAYMDAVGRNEGMMPRQLAGAFAREMREAGVRPARSGSVQEFPAAADGVGGGAEAAMPDDALMLGSGGEIRETLGKANEVFAPRLQRRGSLQVGN
ncbi:hypothetical protein DFJ74DRAFT_744355 [Hyaloraphidium curvatum]|nr:hypothetical protein DFJ74DRAFT_744355 [Hyaloraphidium curvatum]